MGPNREGMGAMTDDETREAIRAARESEAIRRAGIVAAITAVSDVQARYRGSIYRPGQRVETRANRAADALTALLAELDGWFPVDDSTRAGQ